MLRIALVLLLIPAALSAQAPATVDVSVTSSIGEPLSFSTIDVSPGGARFTSEAGHYSFPAQPQRTYRIRVKHLGFAPVDTTISIAGSGHYSMAITMRPVALHLNEISVRDNNSCSRSAGNAQLAVALDQLQQNAERDLLLRNQYPFQYRLAREYDTYDPDLRIPGLRRDTATFSSVTSDKYRPGQIIRRASDKRPRTVREVRIPTLSDLADPVFLRSHCFSFGGVAVIDHVLTYKIDFQPVSGLGNVPDFAGSAYLDATTYSIKRADFMMTNSILASPPIVGLSVSTSYKEIFAGVALFDHIRAVQRIGGNAINGKGEQVDDQKLVGVAFTGEKPDEH